MSERKAFSREELISGATFSKQFVEINESGAGFWVRDVSPREWVDYIDKAKSPECEKVSDSLLLAKAICDENGQRLFTDEEYGLIAEKFSMTAQRKAVRVILEWHGVSKKQVEAAEKN